MFKDLQEEAIYQTIEPIEEEEPVDEDDGKQPREDTFKVSRRRGVMRGRS